MGLAATNWPHQIGPAKLASPNWPHQIGPTIQSFDQGVEIKGMDIQKTTQNCVSKTI